MNATVQSRISRVVDSDTACDRGVPWAELREPGPLSGEDGRRNDLDGVFDGRLSGTERFAYWEAMASQAHFRTTTASDHLDDFLASSQALNLGDIQTFAHSYPPMHSRRTPVMIRQGDPEVLQLWLTVRGEAGSARRTDTPTSARAISCSATPCGPARPKPLPETAPTSPH